MVLPTGIQTFQDVDNAMHAYNRVTGKPLDLLGSEPDFYTLSNSQKDRKIAFINLGMAATGLVAYKLAKRSKLTTPNFIKGPRRIGRCNLSSEVGFS